MAASLRRIDPAATRRSGSQTEPSGCRPTWCWRSIEPTSHGFRASSTSDGGVVDGHHPLTQIVFMRHPRPRAIALGLAAALAVALVSCGDEPTRPNLGPASRTAAAGPPATILVNV